MLGNEKAMQIYTFSHEKLNFDIEISWYWRPYTNNWETKLEAQDWVHYTSIISGPKVSFSLIRTFFFFFIKHRVNF